MVAAIREAAGRHGSSREGAHDPFPGVPDGVPVKVARRRSTPTTRRIEVDLRDNLDCQPCGLNLTEATARTAAMIGVFNRTRPQSCRRTPGSFRRLRIHLRENCVVGIPRHPTSCSVATTEPLGADRERSSQRALGELGEAFGLARDRTRRSPASMAVISGVDPRARRRAVREPAHPRRHGRRRRAPGGRLADDPGHRRSAGFLLPRQRRDRRDEITRSGSCTSSGSSPTARAPAGTAARPAPTSSSARSTAASSTSSTSATAPTTRRLASAAAFPAGRRCSAERNVHGELSEELGAYANIRLHPGETIVGHTCGGGGYGPPHERDPLSRCRRRPRRVDHLRACPRRVRRPDWRGRKGRQARDRRATRSNRSRSRRGAVASTAAACRNDQDRRDARVRTLVTPRSQVIEERPSPRTPVNRRPNQRTKATSVGTAPRLKPRKMAITKAP